MKILLVCLRFPFPPSDGGTIAMFNMANSLKKAGAEVKIIAFNTKKHFVDPEKVPEQFRFDFKPEAVYLDASVKILPAFLNLFTTKSYNISRFDVPEFHVLIRDVLQKEKFDYVQLESLFVTPYIGTIKKYSSASIIFRAHNVEYIIWERLSNSESNPIKKWYLKKLAFRLKRYEISTLSKFNAIVALTEDDKVHFRASGIDIPLLIAPIGLDMENYPVAEIYKSTLTVFHLGSMDWLPNIEGVDWFLQHVFPLLKKNNPEITIHLAGKSMPQRFFELADEQLHVSGRIDDSRKFMHEKSIMIVPLLSGGGMRVKIIEGFAMGKVIISTTIGAEGIKYTNQKNILIADSPVEFYEAIVKCVSDLEYCKNLGTEARNLALDVYENRIVGTQLVHFYNSIKANADSIHQFEKPDSEISIH
ncbi:MAG: glycosyltransferase [Bacteroidetes bacterium]|nr:glycosyltransferase [Bacteroidota bacterium]